MRLWSLHPRYLDRQGLLALWREALLAQQVLLGATRGYRLHPQLNRFRNAPDPIAVIAAYLRGVQEEAGHRGYRFDASRIVAGRNPLPLEVGTGQLRFEWHYLLRKLQSRDPARAAELAGDETPLPHPVFRVVKGSIAEWERGTG